MKVEIPREGEKGLAFCSVIIITSTNEEIDALPRAALKTGWRGNDINEVFCRHSAEMLCEAGMPESFLNA